ILNQLYGLVSADFYKGDPQRYVRTTLITQRLLGIRKLTLHWPVYAFGAEALGQAMLYPKKHAPGVNAGEPLIYRKNWHELGKPDFEGIVPQIIEEMLVCFSELTGREPVAHIPAPYSLAADIFGQEALLFALMDEPDFVADLLAHLTEQVFVPWCARLSQRIPNVWIELSDASGSPVFIGPRLFRKIAAPPVHRLIRDFPWGERVFVANYRGDMPMRQTGVNEQRKVETESATDALIELIDFKLSLCPEFIIKLDADKAPLSTYVEQAIQRGKPLTLGIGATRIDRNSSADRDNAKRKIEKLAADYAQAIKNVSEALAINGLPYPDLPSPCGVYIEDVNAESDLEMVKTIIEAVAIHGKISP
ncbi:MAG: uroporphyrinogen decarboxylase family protein, partial [Chloroflexota bacterium]|nr:uroporphyrinogen decarboxylase family protein [Chloroflexota bacterium]